MNTYLVQVKYHSKCIGDNSQIGGNKFILINAKNTRTLLPKIYENVFDNFIIPYISPSIIPHKYTPGIIPYEYDELLTIKRVEIRGIVDVKRLREIQDKEFCRTGETPSALALVLNSLPGTNPLVSLI
jgi:hypothetical protein